jgi:outer membrane lipoprotein-sorting protein
MVLYRERRIFAPLFVLALALLAGCAAPWQAQTKPTPVARPTPTLVPGQQILQQTANMLNTANTLHGVFNLTISGQNFNGAMKSEVWNETPDKSRTVILQSSVTQITTGSLTVSDGKQIWQYDPAQKVVYHGAVQANTNTGGAPGAGSGRGGFLLNLVQSISTHSDGTLQSSNGTVNGHAVYDVHVVPQSGSASTAVPLTATPGSTNTQNSAANFDYEGEIYIDKATHLPVRLDLNVQNTGHVLVDLPTFELNQPLPANLFAFTIPSGVKVLPLAQGGGTGSLSLQQAQQQAGYHLLSMPSSQTAYTLHGVTALGAPGNQIYTLNYTQGSSSFTIAQGKPLANLPGASGQQISLRGTTGTLSSENGIMTLAWTENGVGIRLSGSLSNDQMVAIAKVLS